MEAATPTDDCGACSQNEKGCRFDLNRQPENQVRVATRSLHLVIATLDDLFHARHELVGDGAVDDAVIETE